MYIYIIFDYIIIYNYSIFLFKKMFCFNVFINYYV